MAAMCWSRPSEHLLTASSSSKLAELSAVCRALSTNCKAYLSTGFFLRLGKQTLDPKLYVIANITYLGVWKPLMSSACPEHVLLSHPLQSSDRPWTCDRSTPFSADASTLWQVEPVLRSKQDMIGDAFMLQAPHLVILGRLMAASWAAASDLGLLAGTGGPSPCILQTRAYLTPGF